MHRASSQNIRINLFLFQVYCPLYEFNTKTMIFIPVVLEIKYTKFSIFLSSWHLYIVQTSCVYVYPNFLNNGVSCVHIIQASIIIESCTVAILISIILSKCFYYSLNSKILLHSQPASCFHVVSPQWMSMLELLACSSEPY